MKRKLTPELPCGFSVVATRDANDSAWLVKQPSLFESISVKATTKNIRAIKQLLDQMLANTPKRFRKD
jgi:hypothetical protein